MALLIKGAALVRAHHPSAAATVYRRVIAQAEDDGSGFDVACGCQALALALLELGHAQEALPLALRAAEAYAAENAPIAAALGRRTVADVYDSLGRYPEALDAIDATVSTLHSAKKLDACIRAELTRVKITLHARPSADITDLCSSIAAKSIDLDATQRTRRRTATAEALAYLRDAAVRRIVSASMVEQIDAYISDLDSGRYTRFTPPVPPLLM
jgi:tetratricopeptide (TPR) repeat protein